MENTRELAIGWWNSLALLRKTELCNSYPQYLGYERNFETLTGREIELIWTKEKDSH